MPRPRAFDRERVLMDAMHQFRDQGYEATSIQDLVDCMGINRFSLYATFGNKHDLFVSALEMYYDRVAVPFFGRMATSGKGIAIIETVLLELVQRIKSGTSPNGCLICNSIAELGNGPDHRTAAVFTRYLRRIEADFRAAIEHARTLGEVPRTVDARGHARRLVTFSTGLLAVAKVLPDRELRASVRTAVRAIQ